MKSQAEEITIRTDGAARGNPGPAAIAYIIERPGETDIEVKDRLGEATNNVAEYTALVRALEHARQLGAKRLQVLSDSELLVRQMNGQYKVKNESLRSLFEKAQELRRAFESVKIGHVRREENARTDRLCNEALDGEKEPGRKKSRSGPAAFSAVPQPERVQEEAIQCLRTMAAAWARGDPRNPRPEDVWEQLWTILEDGGVLRSRRSP